MSLVHLIRHGRAAAAWGGGDPDPGLDEQGLRQAEAAAAALYALGEGARPRLLASSPLRRCRETAQAYAARLGGAAVDIDPRVAEIPTPRGVPDTERGAWLRAAFEGDWSEISGDLDYLSWRDAVAAAVAARPGAAIFTHFVALNAAVSAALGTAKVRAFEPDHASITTFQIEEGRLRLVSLGRVAETRVL